MELLTRNEAIVHSPNIQNCTNSMDTPVIWNIYTWALTLQWVGSLELPKKGKLLH